MGCPIEIIPIPLDDFLQDLMLWVPEELRSKFTSGLARSIKFVANCSFPNFLQYRLGHDRSARAQGMPMRSQRRRHTPWRRLALRPLWGRPRL
jgi:hypothetical protein